MKKITTENFLLTLNKQLSGLDLSKSLSPNEAKDEAMRIVATIPNLIRNYFMMREEIHSSPVRIMVYSLYQKELAIKEPFGGTPADNFKTFKGGTVGYYLCQMLHALGFYFTVWCGQIDILMNMLGGSTEGVLNFLNPITTEVKIID